MSNDKISYFETNFSRAAFKNLSDQERSKLSETAQDVISFLNQFAMLHKVKSKVRLWLVEDPVQNIESDCYRVFQIYFCAHFIWPKQ